MTFRNKTKKLQNKNKHTFKRLVRCSERHMNSEECAPCEEEKKKSAAAKKTTAPKVQLSQKDVSNILIDISMKALYNEGDKTELRLVEDILTPNQIQFNDKKSLESYWDIITNSGFIKPSIGFGNNGKVSLSKSGFDLMNQFGGYMNFLQSQQNPQGKMNLPQAPMPTAEEDADEGVEG